jgi:lipid-binding SYLF domain-containing protein
MAAGRLALLALAFGLVGTAPVVAQDDPHQGLVDRARATVERFAKDPVMAPLKPALRKGRAVFVVPELIKGGVFVGAAGGSGVVLFRGRTWSDPAFYQLGGLNLGFQLGGEVSEMILVLMTERAIDVIMATDATLGADLSFAIGASNREQPAAPDPDADILVFELAKGVYAVHVLEGAAIRPRPDWNRTYYGRPASTRDVLVRRVITTTKADALKAALTSAFR